MEHSAPLDTVWQFTPAPGSSAVAFGWNLYRVTGQVPAAGLVEVQSTRSGKSYLVSEQAWVSDHGGMVLGGQPNWYWTATPPPPAYPGSS